MPTATVHLLKPGKGTTTTYTGEVIHESPGYVLVHARWERPTLDLGYVTFTPGDHFYEHYYADRWYNVFDIRATTGERKGWYCNITRPARITGWLIESEDLELDLFVSPDRGQLLRLDEDEFERRRFAASDPALYATALAALDELEILARCGVRPFGPVSDE